VSGCVAAHVVGRTSRSILLVDLLHDRVELCLNLFLLGFVVRAVGVCVALEELEPFINEIFDSPLLFVGELALQLLVAQCALHLEAVVLEAVLGIDLLAGFVVLVLEALSVLDHLLDLLGAESVCVGLDLNRLRLTVRFVDCLDVENTVRVDIEGDLYLRSASWSKLDSFEVELAELVIVLGHWPFSFEDLDLYSWLVVRVGREGLSLLAWDLRVSRDDVGHDATGCLDSLRKRGDVDKQHILERVVVGGCLIAEDGCLNSSAVSDCFVRVDGSVQRLPVEEFREHGLDLRDPGRASNEDDVMNLPLADVGVLEHLLDRWHALAEEREAKLFKLGSRDCGAEVFSLSKRLTVDF